MSSSRSIRSSQSRSSKGFRRKDDDDGTTASTTSKSTIAAQQDLVPQPDTPVEMAKLIVEELRKSCKSDVVDSVYEFLEVFIEFTEEADEETTKKNKETALMMGAPDMIFIAMEKLYDDEEVQASCCCCLEFLTHRFDDGVRAVLKAGGLKAVVDALIAFPDSRDVQIAGYAVLSNIFDGLNQDPPPPHVLEAALRFSTKLHGLEMLMICSYEYAKDPTLPGILCTLLANLSARAETRDAFSMALEYHHGSELLVGDEHSEVSSLGDGKVVAQMKQSEEECASH